MAQLPNFHKLLKKNDIDFEMHTAGEYKRTLTVFGENTDKAREKFQADLDDVHACLSPSSPPIVPALISMLEYGRVLVRSADTGKQSGGQTLHIRFIFNGAPAQS